jgi:MFS family permease
VSRAGAYVRSLKTDVPGDVYVLQGGLVLNAFGNGAANPFIVLYLHDVRGIPLALAGAAGGIGAASGLVAALVAGSAADRVGARAAMIAGLVCSTIAFALLPLIRDSWQMFVLLPLAGIGSGTWLTMQSSLLAAITPPAARAPAFAQQRVVANVGLGLGGFIGGTIVTTNRPGTFTTLFFLNAVTFLAYAPFIVRLRVPPLEARAVRPVGYRAVLADGAFMRFAALNFAFVAGAIALFNGLCPVYVKNEAGISERTIGAFFLLNSLLIIALQLPTARAVQGRRRMRGFALMGGLFASCWLLVLAGGQASSVTIATLLVAAGVTLMSVGECIYDSIQGPLAASLAPAELLGRYMAVVGFSWQFGFIVGPTVGAAILGAWPNALWPVMSVVCASAGAYALLLEPRLPAGMRATPLRT